MSYREIVCYLFGHKFGRWTRNKIARGYHRTCSRCATVQTDTARTPYARKRAADAADTTQGV